MLGLIQKLLIGLIDSVAGPEAVAEVKRLAGVPEDKVYRMYVVYEDEEWNRLFASACKVLKLSRHEAVLAYADYFCRDAMERWPMWFHMSANARELLERQPVIHNSFATGVQDPEARKSIIDKFNLEKCENELVMHYRSPNQLCDLYRALAEWIIDHYGDNATVEETSCIKRGDSECQIHILWA